MKPDRSRWLYARLADAAALRILERPYLYHTGRDELYELDNDALALLGRCDGTAALSDLPAEPAFIDYCLAEGLIELRPTPAPAPAAIERAPCPSLRYLELQLLGQCNLNCRHCYLGPGRSGMLGLRDALSIALQFESMGGLRLLISGGEPLLYPFLETFIEQTAGQKLRRVLITNGTMITPANISRLRVDEIQFSLDGWRRGHEMLRGQGTFNRTLRGIRSAAEAGIDISLATMVHRGNLDDFDSLQRFAHEMGAREWGIDVLCVAGALKKNRELVVPYETAAALMKRAYGGKYHGSSDGYACGRHLLTVMPTGQAAKCGFYEDHPLGDARQSLRDCWLKLKHVSLSELECRRCPAVEACAGGCRFRAPGPLAPDPAMCALHRPEDKEMPP